MFSYMANISTMKPRLWIVNRLHFIWIRSSSFINNFFLHFVDSSITEKQELSNCVGCGGQIHDQYILRVAPDLEWHAACLKCQECRQFLDERCTCFVRDGKTYCKRDYVRWVDCFRFQLLAAFSETHWN